MRKESEPAVENYSEESYVGNYGEFVYHGCVFRGRDEHPVCGKVRSNSCSQKYYDRWCRTIFIMLLTAVCNCRSIVHVEPSQLICRSSTYSEACIERR
ncbi:hypothetical protein TNCV_3314021 [Trichonephila clavipes]|nr:hypothetical protein TNCV_3314021 [Trichonephila clavipes]